MNVFAGPYTGAPSIATGVPSIAIDPSPDRPPLADLISKADNVMADCMDKASAITRLLSSEEGVGAEPRPNPTCLADHAMRVCDQASDLLLALERIARALGA